MKKTLLFAISLSFLLAGCEKKGEAEILIIPRDFKGYVIIAYDQKNGLPIKYEGDKRVYEIPQLGVLKTQFKPNNGWKEFPEYYYERIAPENKLPSIAEINLIPMDKVVGFMGATGTVRVNNYNEDRIEFSEFFIGTKLEIKHSQEQTAKLDIMKLLR